MDQDKQPTQKRVKVVGDATHRTGERRAAIKPHKRTTEVNYKQLISDYVNGLGAGSLTQTFWGATIDKNAAALQANFGLQAGDEPYLLLDPTKSGRSGLLLSATGVHLADGRGNTAAIAWKDLPSRTIAYKGGMLVIGTSGVASRDGQVVAQLLQQIQAKVSA